MTPKQKLEREVDKILNSKLPTVELYRDNTYENSKKDKTWFIRKGLFRTNCVCDELTLKDLEKLYTKIGKILGKIDWKKEMEKDRDLFIK